MWLAYGSHYTNKAADVKIDIVSQLPHSNPDGFPLPVKLGFLLSSAVPRSPRVTPSCGRPWGCCFSAWSPPPAPPPQGLRGRVRGCFDFGPAGALLEEAPGGPGPRPSGTAKPCPAEDNEAGNDALAGSRGICVLCPAVPPGPGHRAGAVAVEGLPKARSCLSSDKCPFLCNTGGQSCFLQGVSPATPCGSRLSPRYFSKVVGRSTPLQPLPFRNIALSSKSHLVPEAQLPVRPIPEGGPCATRDALGAWPLKVGRGKKPCPAGGRRAPGCGPGAHACKGTWALPATGSALPAQVPATA